jgi:hypothetical protein
MRVSGRKTRRESTAAGGKFILKRALPAQRRAAEAGVGETADTATGSQQEPTSTGEPESDEIDGFSFNASRDFFVFVNRFIVDLERLSRFKARQSAMETVNSAHVKEAASFLASASASPDKPRKAVRYCETFGGLMVGGGLSELCVLLATSNPPGSLIGITIGLIGVGALLIGIFLGRE